MLAIKLCFFACWLRIFTSLSVVAADGCSLGPFDSYTFLSCYELTTIPVAFSFPTTFLRGMVALEFRLFRTPLGLEDRRAIANATTGIQILPKT